MSEADWEHLKRYGYAPGNYMNKCMEKINRESQFQVAAWINGARALERLLRQKGASL